MDNIRAVALTSIKSGFAAARLSSGLPAGSFPIRSDVKEKISDARGGALWVLRAEAVNFAASEPVTRQILAKVVGKSCNIDLLIDDIREELRGRPHDLVAVAGGWKHLTRPAYADAIRTAVG